MTETLSINYWSGTNYRDQSDALLSRSHQQVQGGWQQFPGVGTESPDAYNIDYDPQGLQKRLGSASYNDLSGTIATSEALIGGFEFRNSGGSRTEFAVGTEGIYTDQSGSWAALNNSTSAAFQWVDNGAVITMFTVAFADGHYFIGSDGAGNEIQTGKGGADLDAEMKNGNLYEFAYGSATAVAMTGVWPTAVKLVSTVHGRLCFSTGDVLVEYTPMGHTASSGIYDLGGSTGGAFHAAGDIRMMTNFIPKGANIATDEMLVVGTANGMEMSTGFLSQDRLNREGGEAPLNHQSFCHTQNWIVYLTDQKNIKGFNGASIIDLGARLKSANKDGPLDNMSITQSETDSFALYDSDNEQAKLWFTTSSARVNDTCAVIDFKEGEPVHGEPRESYERRVRIFPWSIISPDDNDWFKGGYVKGGAVVGVKSDGNLYTMNSGKNDLGNLAINWYWKSPIITGGPIATTRTKQWSRLSLRAIPTGLWDITVSEYHDRETAAFKTWAMSQAGVDAAIVGEAVVGESLVSGGGVVRNFNSIRTRSEAFQFQLANAESDEEAIITSAIVQYSIGAEVN